MQSYALGKRISTSSHITNVTTFWCCLFSVKRGCSVNSQHPSRSVPVSSNVSLVTWPLHPQQQPRKSIYNKSFLNTRMLWPQFKQNSFGEFNIICRHKICFYPHPRTKFDYCEFLLLCIAIKYSIFGLDSQEIRLVYYSPRKLQIKLAKRKFTIPYIANGNRSMLRFYK
jgi:hypothetical protein